jgi:hypothetical protein
MFGGTRAAIVEGMPTDQERAYGHRLKGWGDQGGRRTLLARPVRASAWVVGSPYRQAHEPSLSRSCPLAPRSGLRFCYDRHSARAHANCAFCRHRSPRRRRFVGVAWENPWCHLEACAGRLPGGRPPGLGSMPCASPRSRVEMVSGRTPASAARRRCESSSCRGGSPRAPAGPPLAGRFPPDVAEGPSDAGAGGGGSRSPVAGPGQSRAPPLPARRMEGP